MHGTPKYPESFEHFDYVRPDAPKGGLLRLAKIGSFDSLNPYILKGVPAEGRRLVFESLLARSFDEPFTLYGLVAERVEMPVDRAWVVFTLNPQAQFNDGTPITADDVLFSWRTLKDKGRPHMRTYYAKVKRAERLGDRRVKFSFRTGDHWELPLIMGLMPVLSRAYYTRVAFDRTSLEPPLTSGPYRVERVDPGRSITYRRNPRYWGANLAVNRGRHNFDTIRYDYYRDADVALEAFKAGEYDLRLEPDADRWARAYDHPAVRDGRILLEEIRHGRPVGMFALVFNTRRPHLGDRRVREALGYAFDFEWINRALFHGAYARTMSYFENSEFAAREPIGPRELELLAPHRANILPQVFTDLYRPPTSDGSGHNRANLRIASRLLEEAGWKVTDGVLVSNQSEWPFELEILLGKPWLERVMLPYARNLERLGIKARIRTVDSAQYENRTGSFDFDAIVHRWGQSLSPGNEQAIYWGSPAADSPGSRNYAGIRDPVVDALIDHLAGARNRADLIAAARALDRVLLWGQYVVPLFHSKVDRIAYWNHLEHFDLIPRYGVQLDTWWATTP